MTVKLPVYNKEGKQIEEVSVSKAVFGIEPNEDVIVRALNWQLNKLRRGTAATKTRSEVRGGGAKPWRQKGTGRARAGTNRSPLWNGGGVIFGPRPRSFATKLPKKMRELAIKSLLSDRCANGKIMVIDDLALKSHKTREMATIIDKLGFLKIKKILVAGKEDENIKRSSANLKDLRLLSVDELNVYDLLNSEQILLLKDSLKMIEEKFN